MGSPEKIYPPTRLKRLSAAQKKALHRRIKQQLKKDPLAGAIVSSHRKLSVLLRKKLDAM